MRLMVGSNNLRAYVNDTQRQGWVEMCVNGKYRRVCDENWSNEEASVVCGELGLSRYGRLGVSYGSLVLYILCLMQEPLVCRETDSVEDDQQL